MAVLAGNWKMHKGPRDTERFFESLDLPESLDGHEVMIFPSAVSVASAVACAARDPRIAVGVQNIHWEDKGAFTGELSAPMAREAGATLALVGHSERRHVFGESDEEVGRKVAAARRHGLVPVVCVGETLEERRAGRVEEVTVRQIEAALAPLAHDPGRVLVAYEPVWAIGTGETATPEDASAAHATLRSWLAEHLGEGARSVPILYGGSVNPGNAAELLAAAGVDGVLVGGASLDPASFAAIVAAAG